MPAVAPSIDELKLLSCRAYGMPARGVDGRATAHELRISHRRRIIHAGLAQKIWQIYFRARVGARLDVDR